MTMFRMAMHIPYYAWRKTQHCDLRKFENEPLRSTRDVSFLGWDDHERSGFLHEAQVSCVITGLNNYLWTAYCFADIFFEPKKTRESLMSNMNSQGLRVDPFRNGKTISDRDFHDPRIYFLAVLRVRLEQIRNEWQQVLQKLEASVRGYEKVCGLALVYFLSSPLLSSVIVFVNHNDSNH